LAPSRALLADVHGDLLELVSAAGVRATVSVGGCPRGRAAGVAILKDHGPEGLLVDGGVEEGPYDVLALPKAARELQEGGWSDDDVRRAFVDNAMAFYGLSAANPPIGRQPSPRASAP
jgi:predicted metal-dependent TIM-barrel fold hydrolase